MKCSILKNKDTEVNKLRQSASLQEHQKQLDNWKWTLTVSIFKRVSMLIPQISSGIDG